MPALCKLRLAQHVVCIANLQTQSLQSLQGIYKNARACALLFGRCVLCCVQKLFSILLHFVLAMVQCMFYVCFVRYELGVKSMAIIMAFTVLAVAAIVGPAILCLAYHLETASPRNRRGRK